MNDLSSPLTSTSIQVILAFIIIILAGVIVYQNRKVEQLYKEKDELQDQRRIDTQEVIDKYNEAMGSFSKTTDLLYRKLEGKG